MTVSGSTDFTMTRNEIIRQALLQCGELDPQETVDPLAQKDMAILLNLLVKQISAKKPLWGVVDYTIPLYDNKQSYTLGPGGNKNISRPLSLGKQARRTSANSTNEIAINQIGRDEYMGYPVKTTTGETTSFYYDPQLVKGVLYVWPVSSTQSTTLTDWTASSATEQYFSGTAIDEPTFVFLDGTELTQGTVGSLATGEYGWGDNDGIGYDTLYVYSASAPSELKILATDPPKLIITAHRELSDFDTATNTPDFPVEAYQMLIWNLALMRCPVSNPNRITVLAQYAKAYMDDYLTSDSEQVNFRIIPG